MEKTAALNALAALAQASRLDIFRLLVEAGQKGMAAGQIGERLGLPSPTLSFHLSQLKHAGLVRCRREGRSLFYSASFPVMIELVAYLSQNCCGSGAESCGINLPVAGPSQERALDKLQME